MRLKLPAAYYVDEKTDGNPLRQLSALPIQIEGTLARYKGDQTAGYVFTPAEGSIQPIHLLYHRPPENRLAQYTRVVLCQEEVVDPKPEELDLSRSRWLRYACHEEASGEVGRRDRHVLQSWRGAFSYVQEDVAAGVVGLRLPQVGALHAVQAHWTVSSEAATVVMPTGTGKTETMLAVLVAERCQRVLVVVPTDALRTQLAAKFETLGALKVPGSKVLAGTALFPLVRTLKHAPATPESVADLFVGTNVVVTTSQIAGRCIGQVRERMAELCTHLFIDEAHHAEAPTWKEFKSDFKGQRVLQFTATPFRDDERLVDGRIIFRYPLRKAQEENYFRPIRFASVAEFDHKKSDVAISRKAIEELRADATGKHIVMARVATIARAAEIFPLYEAHPEYNPVVLHTGVSASEREQRKQQLFNGLSRIVVCVDMLGEGFDLPELKIAAFHDIRKSLAVTLQLAGRFTRSRADLGNATFIANTAAVDVRDELQKLYSRDPDWNELLPPLSDAAIEEQVKTKEFVDGFSRFPPEFPLKEIRPAASTVIYKTSCDDWSPLEFLRGLHSAEAYDAIHHTVNVAEKMLVIVCGRSTPTEWAELDGIRDWTWELFVALWDSEQNLLFIHGSGNSGEFRALAEAVAGNDVRLIKDPDLFRCFFGMGRLMLNNVGLTEQLGRLVSFTARMGADVGTALSDAQKRNTRKAVLFGAGYEGGGRTTVGASKKGRVWSFQRLRLDRFATWCKAVGAKVIDTRINPDEVLKGTLEPVMVPGRPNLMPISIDWPEGIYDELESVFTIVFENGTDALFHTVGIELVDPAEIGDLTFRIFTEDESTVLRLELFERAEGEHDYRVVHVRGQRAFFKRRQKTVPMEAFLDAHPPPIWFVDGSYLEGNQHVSMRTTYEPFDREKIQAWDWAGVNLRKESQGMAKETDSIQRRVIETALRQEVVGIVFDDDGAGESADVVTVSAIERDGRHELDVQFFHCKYTRDQPGARVEDLYAVCGQAQKSINWLYNSDRHMDLFLHLLKREPKRQGMAETTRYELGDQDTLLTFKEMSRVSRLNLKIFIVQPGLSKAKASRAQLDLLACTENYLQETFSIPFGVIGSA